jgi:hypothetical protein
MGTIVSRFADTVGDGTGSKNANGNYATTAETFYLEAGANEVVNIARMLVTVEDSTGMDATKYGNNITLTNGISVHCEGPDAVKMFDLTDPDVPIKTNAEWGMYCHDASLKTWGSGNDLLLVRWTFERSGTPVQLHPGDKLIITLNDNFTGLVAHRFLLQGMIYSKYGS